VKMYIDKEREVDRRGTVCDDGEISVGGVEAYSRGKGEKRTLSGKERKAANVLKRRKRGLGIKRFIQGNGRVDQSVEHSCPLVASKVA